MNYIYCQYFICLYKTVQQSCWNVHQVALIFESNIALKMDIVWIAWRATQEKIHFGNCFQCIKVFLTFTSIFKISDKNLTALYMFARHISNFHVFSILLLPFLKHCSFPLSYFRIVAMKKSQNKSQNPKEIFSAMIQEISISEKEEQVMKTAETSYWQLTCWLKKTALVFLS